MTKRILALALLAALLLTGCQRAPDAGDAYNPATDCDYLTVSQGWYSQFAESDKGYYMSVCDFLLYIDKESMRTVPLCAKPNCLHEKETDQSKREQCDAYFECRSASWSPIYYMDGYVYICITSPTNSKEWQLVRVREDGSERTVMLTFPARSVQFACIHRGYFYYATEDYDENGKSICRVLAYSLDRRNGDPQVLYQTENVSIPHYLFSGLFAYGNQLYLTEAIGFQRYALRIIDLKSRESTVVPFPEGMDNVIARFIHNGRLYVTFAAEEGLVSETGRTAMPTETVWYSYRLDGSDAQYVGDLSNFSACADDQYIYRISWSGTGSSATRDFTLEALHIMDETLTDVCVRSVSDFDQPGLTLIGLNPVLLRGDIVLLSAGYSGGVYVLYAFDRADIEADVIEPVEVFRYSFEEYND